ncbi:MAG: BrnA antitoxin family protein [Candidatus Acidiferrales bacterium]
MKKLTKAQLRDIRAIADQKDEEIDFSDIPPVLDWSGAEIGKFYRPPKKPVTLRLDADVIEWLKSAGTGYQTRANALLRHAMLHYKRTQSQKAEVRAQKRHRAGRKNRAA